MIVDWINSYIKKLSESNPFTNTIGLARSLLALSLFMTLAFNDVDLLFSNPNQDQFCLSVIQKFSIYCLFGQENFLYAKMISISILVISIVGIYPRYTGIFHWWVSISFFISSPYVDGGDQITSILTFLLIPITLLDSRKWHWKNSVKITSITKNLIANISHKVIRVQVCIVYLHAVIAKLELQEWIDGTIIYYWFTHITFGLNSFLRPIILPIVTNNILVFSTTWTVLTLELILFTCIFSNQNLRYLMLFLGLFFHFLIFIVHGLGTFGLSMSAALILYLYPIDKNIFALFKKSSKQLHTF